MRAIQCYSSRPMTEGRQASGLFGDSKEIFLDEHVRLCMILSALQWRWLNGPITLYTDTPMKRYLDKYKLLGYWDDVNTEVLDRFYEECEDINFSVFWSAGKFACYLHEKAPFVCLDTDLIVWDTLEFDEGLDFAFAHWEQIEEGDESYPDVSRIHKPEGYKDGYQSGKNYICDNLACNMAAAYIGSEAFRKEFVECAMAFMRKNPVEREKKYALPEVLYMEQRLPLMLACKNGLNFAPILSCTWSPKKFCIVNPSDDLKHWFFSDLDSSKPFTHLWFHKKYLAQNKEAREEYCAKLRQLCSAAEQKGKDGTHER